MPGEQRDESLQERLDRNTTELVGELRVAAAGIQVLFGFLLVVPFYAGFKEASSFERADYFVTLVCIASATVLLIAPAIHHRLLFRHGEKAYLIGLANRFAIAAGMLLTVGLTGILVLISDVVFGGAAPWAAGIVTFTITTGLWFVLPLNRLRRP